jgi:preprotein translocase subunit SecF|tara:strand:- start:97 stop:711 length:615 start_codon:yes stop_codon:yes gene_type:complete
MVMDNSIFLKLLLVSFFILAFFGGSFAQSDNENSGSLDAGTIESQYDYIWKSSNKYQDHKVVRAFKLNKFRDNVIDSLKALEQEIISLNISIVSKNSSNRGLNTTIDTLNTQLFQAISEKESFSILGTSTSKSIFKSLFWTITFVLGFLLIFSFFRLKSKTAIAKEARVNFSMLEHEFEDFKKRSREKEQVLARQLQNEINKNL